MKDVNIIYYKDIKKWSRGKLEAKIFDLEDKLEEKDDYIRQVTEERTKYKEQNMHNKVDELNLVIKHRDEAYTRLAHEFTILEDRLKEAVKDE